MVSLLLSRSGDCAMRLAVTGAPAGMSTRAPLPATLLTSENDWGGTGVITVVIRPDAWVLGRAAIAPLSTTTLAPPEPAGDNRRRPAAPCARGTAPTGLPAPAAQQGPPP